MRTKSLLLTFTILGCFLAGVSPGQEIEAVRVYARGDYAGVVKLLAPIHAAGKANIQQRLILARAQLHLNRRDDALGVLKSVLAADKENPEANRLTGKILHERGRHTEALEYLRQAYRLKQDPATASVLGKCHYALGDPVKAKVHLEKALKADVRDPTNSLVLGKICLARGMGALAQKYLLLAEEAGLASPELYLLLGRAYLLQRKYVGPVRARRLPAPARPGDLAADHVVLGPIDGVKDTYKVATRYCALHEGYRLLKASPASADGRFMLAAGWLAAGNTDLAAKHLKRLMQVEPDSRRALELEVRLLLAKKDYAAVAKALVAAGEKKVFGAAEMSRYYCHAANALRAEGKRKDAIRLLTRAEKLTPTSGAVLRSLAALYLGDGKKDEARRYYGRLVELFPDADDIDELRNIQRVLGEKKAGAQ